MLIVKETWEDFQRSCRSGLHGGNEACYHCNQKQCPRLWSSTTPEVAEAIMGIGEDISDALLKLTMLAGQLDPCDGKDLCDGRDSQDAV